MKQSINRILAKRPSRNQCLSPLPARYVALYSCQTDQGRNVVPVVGSDDLEDAESFAEQVRLAKSFRILRFNATDSRKSAYFLSEITVILNT